MSQFCGSAAALSSRSAVVSLAASAGMATTATNSPMSHAGIADAPGSQ
jgi:hypothetical protein